MEALFFSIGFCIAGVLIGWELKNVVLKFKQDKQGMIERDRRERNEQLDRSIIVEAEKIINDHLRRKAALESLRKQQKGEE